MADKNLIVPWDSLDFDNVVSDIEAIREVNPQRFEMEQLTAIIYEDLEKMICVGYKDLTLDEFWVRGHMPSMPLMPGVIMLESIAQCCGYFAKKHDILGAKMIGFGGLEDVRFREPVIPGDRFVTMCEFVKARRGRMIISRFQGVVKGTIVANGTLKGIPIPVEMLAKQMPDS